MSKVEKIKLIQHTLEVKEDGIWGPKTEAALRNLLGESEQPSSASGDSKVIVGKASSFADPADVAAFKKCKAQGRTDQDCFSVGDNGIGAWGADTTDESIPYVAVQPDYMELRWGTVNAANGKRVLVTIHGITEECVVGDRMPWIKNTKNRAVIDLAPGAQKLFGLTPPFLVDASWKWA